MSGPAFMTKCPVCGFEFYGFLDEVCSQQCWDEQQAAARRDGNHE